MKDRNQIIGYAVIDRKTGNLICETLTGACSIFATVPEAVKARNMLGPYASRMVVEEAKFWHIFAVLLTGSAYEFRSGVAANWNKALVENAEFLKNKFPGVNITPFDERDGCNALLKMDVHPVMAEAAMKYLMSLR